VVSSIFLHFLYEFSPFDTVLFSETSEGFLDTRLHTFKSAHVNVGVVFLHKVPELFSILLHFVLDVHLIAIGVSSFSADSIIILEMVSSQFFHLLELIVVEKGAAGWDTEEQPCLTTKLEVIVLFHEVSPEERSEWSNTSSGCKHDNSCVWVSRLKKSGSYWTSDIDFITFFEVTEIVGADTLNFFSFIIVIDESLDAERNGLGITVVSWS